jgi:predicted nucleic acid-binding protein
MNITVTDACIFIDLIECNACEAFLNLPCSIITSYQVWMELEEEQRSIILNSGEDQLAIVQIEEDFISITKQENLSQQLSIADRSVWFLAKNRNGILLTSDGTLRKMGKNADIETHGLLWIFDQMVQHQTLSTSMASTKLQKVFDENAYYRTDQKLKEAFQRLLKKWDS